MEKTIRKIQKTINHKFLIASALISTMVLAGCLSTIIYLDNTNEYSSLINKAGYQRMLSQKIIKTIYDENKEQVIFLFDSFKANHQTLKPFTKEFKEQDLLESFFQIYLKDIECFINDCPLNLKKASLNSERFLYNQNSFVNFLEAKAKHKEHTYKQLVIYLSLLTILMVCLSYLFLLKPSSKNLEFTLNEYNKNQENIKKLYSSAEIGRLSANIFHEMKNNLAILSGFLRRAVKENQDENIRPYLEKCSLSSKRLEELALSMNKVNHKSEKKENILVTDLLNDFYHSVIDLVKKNNSELFYELNEDFSLFANQNQIFNVLLNLVKNAIDANENHQEKWIKIKTEIKNDTKRIIVQDSGNGIEPSVLDKIFTPYFTTKGIGKGTGLGMSISKEIIKQQGGDIKYELLDVHTAFILEFSS